MYSGTLTTLANGATFTGPARMTNRDDRVTGLVFADQAGTLHIEQTNDPKAADPTQTAVWDLDTTQAVVASTGASFSIELVAPFWRIRYVNGGVSQGAFRLHARTASAGDS